MKTSRTSRRLVAMSAVIGLALVACGGSDQAGSDAAGNAPDDGVTGVGSNDELEETLDDVGVDLDLDELEDAVSGFSTGEGGGTITIDGQPHAFEAEMCFVYESDLSVEGPGTAPDGRPFWGAIVVSDTTREEMANFGMSDEQLDPMFGDKEVLIDVTVDVEYGRTEMFGSGPEDQPLYTASILLGSPAQGEIDFALDDSTITASGHVVDNHEVTLEWDETLPFDLVAGCS